MLDDLGGIALACPAPQQAQLVDPFGDRGVDVCLRGFERQLQGRVSRIQRQDDQSRGKVGELGVVHQQRLTVHAIGRDVHRERQATLQARDTNRRHQMIDGMR